MPRIVVAVADGEDREALAASFRALGHTVVEARGARGCAAALEEEAPQALVLDPRLPGFETSGLLHLLRRSPALAGTRVSLLARGMDPGLWEFLARQMFDFVIEEGKDETGAVALAGAGGRAAAPPEAPARERTRTMAPPSPPPAAPRRILVVEDEPTYGILLGTEFQSRGWTTLCAASCEAALEMLKGENVHAILSDINMAGMEGDEFAWKIRKEHPGIKIVLMTGMPKDRYPEVPEEVPILPKPINVGELMRAMRFLKQG